MTRYYSREIETLSDPNERGDIPKKTLRASSTVKHLKENLAIVSKEVIVVIRII